MLDLSKMEFENTQFSGKKFDLRDLLRDVAMEASPLFTERKLSFEVETGTGPVSVL
jgi:signal transduction histidine kinase